MVHLGDEGQVELSSVRLEIVLIFDRGGVPDLSVVEIISIWWK
jgi:hypothetical protein